MWTLEQFGLHMRDQQVDWHPSSVTVILFGTVKELR